MAAGIPCYPDAYKKLLGSAARSCVTRRSQHRLELGSGGDPHLGSPARNRAPCPAVLTGPLGMCRATPPKSPFLRRSKKKWAYPADDYTHHRGSEFPKCVSTDEPDRPRSFNA